MGTLSRLNWDLEMLVFEKVETGVPRENPLGAKHKNQFTNYVQTPPGYDPESGKLTQAKWVGDKYTQNCATHHLIIVYYSKEPISAYTS